MDYDIFTTIAKSGQEKISKNHYDIDIVNIAS